MKCRGCVLPFNEMEGHILLVEGIYFVSCFCVVEGVHLVNWRRHV